MYVLKNCFFQNNKKKVGENLKYNDFFVVFAYMHKVAWLNGFSISIEKTKLKQSLAHYFARIFKRRIIVPESSYRNI